MSCINFCCIIGKVVYKFHEKIPKIGRKWLLRQLSKVYKIKAKTAVFKKLIEDMWLEIFHFLRNSGRKLKGVRWCDLKASWKWSTKRFFLFSTFITMLCFMCYTGYASKKVLKFDLIKFISAHFTAQKMKFLTKDFFSKCSQIRRKLWIWSHLLKKSSMENFIF